MIGKRLAHYRLLEHIGSGGMGDVYRARDEQLHRDVAVKVLHEDMMADASSRARLRKEALLLSQVNHPNVATVHYFGTQDEVTFLAMEYVQGTTLDTLLAGKPLPETEVRRLGVQLAQGLKAAHAHGVIHRDLKPRNLRITSDGLLKILDFGLAQQWQPNADLLSTLGPGDKSSLATSGTSPGIEGTVPYMPPEQLRGGELDVRSDIYSAGMVLYEMAAGKRPFATLSGPPLVAAILSEPPVPPHELDARISVGLSRTILKALEKDPAHRQDGAEELQADLERSNDSLPQVSVVQPRRRLPRLRWAVAAVAIVIAGIVALKWSGIIGGIKAGQIKALAVLPFDDLSAATDAHYFSDGMTDELITRLSQIGAIQVIARHSVMMYRDRDVPLAQIAKELGVDAILEGSVVHAQDRVRVAVRLIVAATGRNMWADSYERETRDVLALQAELARAISERIRAVVTPEERQRLTSSRPIDPRAFDLYLQGRVLADHEIQEDQNKAIEYFRSAIEIEPNYALAYAGLAQVYYQLSTIFMPAGEAMPMARAAAEHALVLDPNLAEAHTILACVQAFYDWDWSAGEASFQRALKLGPGNAVAHMFYAYFLVIRSRFDEAIRENAIARRLDPLSLYLRTASVYPLYEGRRFDQAIVASRELLAAEPTHWHAAMLLGQSLIATGEHREAIAVLQRASDLQSNMNSSLLGFLSVAHAAAGDPATARRILQQMLAVEGSVEPLFMEAVIQVRLGEYDRAFELLEKSVAQRSEETLMIGNDIALDPLRSDPRFVRLQQQMHL